MTRAIPAVCLFLVAFPLAAKVRQHAVTDLSDVTITGVVRNSSGTPVVGAIVHSGTRSSNRNGTTIDGKYTISLPGNRPLLVTAEAFAYEPVILTYTPVKGDTLDITLTTLRPGVTVKLTNGETHVLDLGTSQFAYLVAFSGYVRFDNGNFCKPDGNSIAPAKTEISRIVGPATSVNFSGCCVRGPVMTLNLELKSGEKAQVYFNDSCFGNEVDFIGRERSTGAWQYYNFANIAEIIFP
jgi:hypothetical protein